MLLYSLDVVAKQILLHFVAAGLVARFQEAALPGYAEIY